MRLAGKPRVTIEHSDLGEAARVESKPLHLTATCTVNPGSSSGVNQVALQNPLGTPMEIHEIKWSALAAITSTVVGAGLDNYVTRVNGAALRCRLDLGKIEITNGYVPVCLFGKCDHPSQEQKFGGGTSSANGYSRLEFRWKLSHPLFIPAGGLLSPTFEHGGQITAPIDVRIGYSARSLPAGYKPSKIILPWVASYISPTFDLAEDSTFNSSELDLVNKWDSPLTVDRLTGRLSVFDTRYVVVFDSPFMALAATSLRLMDSAGNAIVRNLTPLSHVFHNPTKSWEMRAVLPPLGYYQAFFQNAAYPVVGTENQFLAQTLVGLVGTREA